MAPEQLKLNRNIALDVAKIDISNAEDAAADQFEIQSTFISAILRDTPDSFLATHENRVLLGSAGRLSQTLCFDDPVLQVGSLAPPTVPSRSQCILHKRVLRIFSTQGNCKTILLPADFIRFWPLSCGLLLVPSSTISIWEVTSEQQQQQQPQPPGGGVSPAAMEEDLTPLAAALMYKRPPLRQQSGGWSPLAFQTPKTSRRRPDEQTRLWKVSMVAAQHVPQFDASACSVQYYATETERSFIFFNPASGMQVTLQLESSTTGSSIGMDTHDSAMPKMVTNVAGVAVACPLLDSLPDATEDTVVLQLTRDGALTMSGAGKSSSAVPPMAVSAEAQERLQPYLSVLDDRVGFKCVAADLSQGICDGSGRRVTLLNQEKAPAAEASRVALDLAPIAAAEFDIAWANKRGFLIEWQSVIGGDIQGECGVEAAALQSMIVGAGNGGDAMQQHLASLGEDFKWAGSTGAAQPGVAIPRESPMVDVLLETKERSQMNVLCEAHVNPLLKQLAGEAQTEAAISNEFTQAHLPEELAAMFPKLNLDSIEVHGPILDENDPLSKLSSFKDVQGQMVDALLMRHNESSAQTESILNDRLALDFLPQSLSKAVDQSCAGLGGGGALEHKHWPGAFESIEADKLSKLIRDSKHSENVNVLDGLSSGFAPTAELKRKDSKLTEPLYAAPLLRPFPQIEIYSPAVQEAEVILNSSTPAPLKGKAGRQGIHALQTTLAGLAGRQMALPLGEAALSLQCNRVLPTEQLELPTLSLAAEVSERNNAQLQLDLSASPPAIPGEAISELSAWPEFHAGVAKGLSLAPSSQLTRTWIVYSKPSMPTYSYGGVLLGLGLGGHLSSLSTMDAYRYLSVEHDPTLMGFLLGISVAKRRSMDTSTHKILALHRQPDFAELEVGLMTHIASIFGIGLLYQSSGHWSVATSLFNEFSRNSETTKVSKSLPGNRAENTMADEDEPTPDCEARVLAAGMALGLVLLGTAGGKDIGYESMQLQLRHLVQGGKAAGSSSSNGGAALLAAQYQTLSCIDTGSLPAYRRPRNTNSTENQNSIIPAACIALALMFIQTNDANVGSAFDIDSSESEAAPPHHLMIKILCRSLVMWDAVQPTQAWVIGQLPQQLRRKTVQQLVEMQDTFRLGAQSHCLCIAGACLALGIRYAGTSDSTAVETLTHFVKYFLKSKADVGYSEPDVEIVESAVAICALALAVVLAGSGNVVAFKLIRALLKRIPVPEPRPNEDQAGSLAPFIGHGPYSLLSLALGFLFLSGGQRTFSASAEAAAYLAISLFPLIPLGSTDNRYYLQALRHFYVLATVRKGESEGSAAVNRNTCILDVEQSQDPTAVGIAEVLV